MFFSIISCKIILKFNRNQTGKYDILLQKQFTMLGLGETCKKFLF